MSSCTKKKKKKKKKKEKKKKKGKRGLSLDSSKEEKHDSGNYAPSESV
jgi:hypothetical protein